MYIQSGVSFICKIVEVKPSKPFSRDAYGTDISYGDFEFIAIPSFPVQKQNSFFLPCNFLI